MTAHDFWKWFEGNNKKYLFLNEVENDIKDQLLNELINQLHKYSDKLSFEIGVNPDEILHELVITASGDLEYFDEVEALIASAPDIKEWKFIAFKQSIGFDFTVDYNGLHFDPSTIWFQPLELENRPLDLGIRILFPDYDSAKDDDFQIGTFLILEAGLGEKTAALEIKYLEIDKLPEDPELEELLPLKQLEGYIKWLKDESVRNN